MFQVVPGQERPVLGVYKLPPAVLKIQAAQDSPWDIRCLHMSQRLLILPAPMEVRAGDKVLKAELRAIFDKGNEFSGTGGAGAPCDTAGNFKSLGSVYLQ